MRVCTHLFQESYIIRLVKTQTLTAALILIYSSSPELYICNFNEVVFIKKHPMNHPLYGFLWIFVPVFCRFSLFFSLSLSLSFSPLLVQLFILTYCKYLRFADLHSANHRPAALPLLLRLLLLRKVIKVFQSIPLS